MGEKRKYQRKISRTRVAFGKEIPDKTAYTSNLSPEGFFVRTNRPYSPGTILHFKFQLADGTELHVQGRVMHVERYPSQFTSIRRSGMGIEILGENKKYLELLQSLHQIKA